MFGYCILWPFVTEVRKEVSCRLSDSPLEPDLLSPTSGFTFHYSISLFRTSCSAFRFSKRIRCGRREGLANVISIHNCGRM